MARGVSFSGTARKIGTLIEWLVALGVIGLLLLGVLTALAALGLLPAPAVVIA